MCLFFCRNLLISVTMDYFLYGYYTDNLEQTMLLWQSASQIIKCDFYFWFISGLCAVAAIGEL